MEKVSVWMIAAIYSYASSDCETIWIEFLVWKLNEIWKKNLDKYPHC